jgi:hypothetical protein
VTVQGVLVGVVVFIVCCLLVALGAAGIFPDRGRRRPS